jgi:hypothetical protein
VTKIDEVPALPELMSSEWQRQLARKQIKLGISTYAMREIKLQVVQL